MLDNLELSPLANNALDAKLRPKTSVIGERVAAVCSTSRRFPANRMKRDFWSSINLDRKSTRLNSSHVRISYAVFCLKKKKKTMRRVPVVPDAVRQTRYDGLLRRVLPGGGPVLGDTWVRDDRLLGGGVRTDRDRGRGW